MKAITLHQPGDHNQLQLSEAENLSRDLSPSEVRIESEVAGINFIDIYFRTGAYPVPLPFILGKEGVGIIREQGSAVDTQTFSLGQRVLYIQNHSGSYAEGVIAEADSLIPVADDISAEMACALGIQGLTAHYLTHSTYLVTDGTKVLIHAAAGGTGQLLTQVAKLRGAYVIATVSTEAKAELAKACGADEVIVYKDYAFREAVEKYVGPNGLDVVYDSVGQATFHAGLACLRKRGMMVTFGQSGGAIPPFNVGELNTYGSLFLTRPTLFHYLNSRDEINERANALYRWVREQKLKVSIDQVFPLSEVAKAHERLESRQAVGKLLLKT